MKKLVVALLILFSSLMADTNWYVLYNYTFPFTLTDMSKTYHLYANVQGASFVFNFETIDRENEEFSQGGKLILQMQGGARVEQQFQKGDTACTMVVPFYKESNTTIPYSFITPGGAEFWVEFEDGTKAYFPQVEFHHAPLRIENFSIQKAKEDKSFEYFTMEINLSTYAGMMKIKTELGNEYYFIKDHMLQSPPPFVVDMNYSSSYQDWHILFRIKKLPRVQQKEFTLIAQDFIASIPDTYIDSQNKSFTVDANETEQPQPPSIDLGSISYDIGSKYSGISGLDHYDLNFTNGLYGVYVRVKLYDMNNSRLPDGYSVKFAFAPADKNTTLQWHDMRYDLFYQVYKYIIPQEYFLQNDTNDYNYTIAFFNGSGEIIKKLQGTLHTIIPNKEELKLQDLIEKLSTQSAVIRRMRLEDNLYHAIVRADSTLLLYEYLRMKNSAFTLPSPLELYSNPFADVDKDAAYYRALVTLANFKGSDDITVLTKKYGIFNPLQKTTRFQFVKMIIEAFDIPKTSDFSYLDGFGDKDKLQAQDAKIYFSTAIKEGLIQGSEDKKLLPYENLTIFQALTILSRLSSREVDGIEQGFIAPDLQETYVQIAGEIPARQKIDLAIQPLQIESITTQKQDHCMVLQANIQSDPQASLALQWQCDKGYFVLSSMQGNSILFCPTSRKPKEEYHIDLLANDGYSHFAKKSITIDPTKFSYESNLADDNVSYVQDRLKIEPYTQSLQEGQPFALKKRGSLYKDKLDIGIEKFVVQILYQGEMFDIKNLDISQDTINFIVPSLPKLYGKEVIVRVEAVTNKSDKIWNFQYMYQPSFQISGVVEENGTSYPSSVYVDGKKVAIDPEDGSFDVALANDGWHQLHIDGYEDIKVLLNIQHPRQLVTIYRKKEEKKGTQPTTQDQNTTQTVTFSLQQGWNLKALPVQTTVSPSTFDSVIIWKWDANGKKWLAYSSNTTLKNVLIQNGITEISSIKPGEGFWVYTTQDESLQLQGRSYELDSTLLTKGWNLVGMGYEIQNPTLLADYNISYAWIFRQGSWYIWGSDIENIKQIDIILPDEGVWIYRK